MDGSNHHGFQETPFLYWHPISKGDSRQQGQFTQSPRGTASMLPSQPSQMLPYSPVAQPMILQANWMADGQTGLSTPVASPRPMGSRPTIFISDESARQHFSKVGEGAWEAHNVPATPALSASGSTVSSPPSSCFSASGNDSTLFGDEPFEDFKHACDAELKSITLTVEDWGNSRSPSLTPISEISHVPITSTQPTTQASDLLCINACPSLSPSPSPHPPAPSQSELDFCDPRLITVEPSTSTFSTSTDPITFPQLPTLCAGDDEEHKLILGDELLTKPRSVFSDSVTHTFPSFENISELESEEDFATSLARLASTTQLDGHDLSSARQRFEFGLHNDDDLVSEPSSDDSDSADHQVINGLPSPPSSNNPSRRGSEDSRAGMRTKRKASSRKVGNGKSVAGGAEISETNFHKMSPSMLSTAAEQTAGKTNSPRQQSSSAQAQTPSASQSQSTSPAASAPPPSSANRRGRKQSLTEDPSKTFVCDLCSRRFRRQEHLKRHYRSLHTLEKPFECNECGKKFSRSDNLAQHARTHGNGAIVMSFLGDDDMVSDEQAESAGDDMVHELGYALYETVHAAAGSTTTASSVEDSMRESESPSPADDDQPRKKRKMM